MDRASPELMAALRGYILRWRLIEAARGLFEGIAGAAVLLTVLALLGSRAHPASSSARTTAFLAVALGIIVVAPVMIRLARRLSPLRAALSLEHAFPYLQDRLATATDLAQRRESVACYSRGLAEHVTREALAALRALPVARAVPVRSVRLPALVAACGVILAALAWVLTPESRAEPGAGLSQAGRAPGPRALGKSGGPQLFDLTLIVTPPRYSALPVRRFSEGLGTVRALRGSNIAIQARVSPPSAGANLMLEPGGPRTMRATQGALSSASFVLSRRVLWRVVVAEGRQEVRTDSFTIVPVADESPRVRLVRPEADLTLDSAGQIEVAASAYDDFAVTSLGIRYRLSDQERWRSLELGARPGPAASGAGRLNLASVGLQAGKELLLRAYATDNDTVSGPKTGLSPVLRIRIRGADTQPANATALQRAQQQEADALSRLRDQAQQLEGELSELLQGLNAGEVSEADLGRLRAQLQEAAERLQNQAGDLETAMREAEQQLALGDLVTPELVEKVRQLHELMQRALNEEMKQALEELQKALKDLNLEQARMSMERAREAQRRFMDRLDQTLALLKRARMEAELAALRKLAEALADRQESLIQQTKGLEEGESTEAREAESAQRRLAGDTDTLTEQVADAAEHAQEVSRQLAGSLDSLTAQLMGADPSGQMRQAASALKRGSPSAAGQPQHGALETLRNAAALLAEMEAQLTGELRSQLTRAAAELVRDCLHVSQRQEELLGETERLAGSGTPDLLRDKQRISPLRRRQDLLASAVQNLARRLTDLARQTPLVDPSFGRDMAAIANSMSQASRELEGAALSQAWERQRASLADLNEAAQRLLELGDKMSQASAQMALSEYLKRLQALAQRQQGLNAQTEQAAQGGQRPSADGMPSLAGLAAEQALIRAALEQMMRAAGGEAKQVADQLGGTPGEMEKVEGDLKAGRLTKETRERQANILQRMLDAQRSLYTKSPERSERKAEHARRYQPAPSPPPLSPSLLRAPSIKAPQASSGDALPAGFEDLVREYYRRLGQ